MDDRLKTRFNDLFLDAKLARQNMLNEGKAKVSIVEEEQSKTARQLLQVEKQAIREKDLNNKVELSYLHSIIEQLNDEVESRMIPVLEDVDNIFNKIVGIDEMMAELLDAVSVKAATISKIEPLATELPWFYTDLMKLINQPKYKRVDSKGRVVLVDSLRVGLSFFGLENLSVVITALAFKRWLPQITDPYPQIKLRIWEEALATANSCKQIASVSGVVPNHAFCLGMLQTTGKIVVTRMYFRLFEEVQREALIESENHRKHDEHKALLKTQPSGEFLISLIDKYAFKISAQLIEKMAMKRVFISNAMDEVHQDLPDADLSPMAKVLKQGNAYAKYRILKSQKLIELDQARDFVRSMKMPKGALELLKVTDVRSLNLSMDEE
ncbi:HDOD domain-containing protein [Paraglaciecola sp.]|uniref:HDOD domain-containing protein n=1 Tax=Paraglaciecola sp. TaxID=1920173 RepID=UPI003EF2AA3E